jgi:glycosyltransferase involved in cell wall biosynthesis
MTLITHPAIQYPDRMTDACESRRIHVLVLTPLYPCQGDEADGCFIADSIECLSELNIDFTTIAVKPWSRSSYRTSDKVPKATWARFPYVPTRAGWAGWGLSIYARVAPFVKRLNRRKRIDLIHAHCAVPCGHPASILARHLGVPFVVTSHGLDVFCKTLNGFPGRWCERSSRFVYERANLNICVSEAVRANLLNGLSSARTTVVYNGVDTKLFAPLDGPEQNATQTILSVGRLVPDKGQEVVIRALAALIEKYPSLRYASIDDGPDRKRLVRLARELNVADRVAFLGRLSRSEVSQAMKRCTVFALPSRNEALGCVYLEAMATGKAVIACRGQGIEDVIRHGENGWLIGPDNVLEMIQALSALLDNSSLRQRIGHQARKTILDTLTLSYQSRLLNQAYRDCLPEKYPAQIGRGRA